MITSAARRQTIAALRQLRSGGGCPDSPGARPELGATLSVIKALQLLGSRSSDPDAVCSFVESAYDPAHGAWAATPGDEPSVLATAAGLLCLGGLGATPALRQRLLPGMRWMAENARTREDHFMTIAVAQECGVRPPASPVAYFRAWEQTDGTFGADVLHNAIAAGALLRAGEPLRAPRAVAELVMAGQAPTGGFTDATAKPRLWTSYCVMRLLNLLGLSPDTATLAAWVRAMSLDDGGFSEGGEPTLSAATTYQCLSILDWIAAPVLDAARRGDTTAVDGYLRSGGDPDLSDLTGWTPLAAAAVRGRSAVVQCLLSAGDAADPGVRVADADALPIYWAGQAGDIGTVEAILERSPGQLFATSSINGHTLLLQAVFFGSVRHRDLITWLFQHLGGILGIPGDDETRLRAARRRLLAACNVRGYTPVTMARLWHNEPLIALLSAVDETTQRERDEYRAALLSSIALPEPADPGELAAQRRTDSLLTTISDGFGMLNAAAADPGGDVAATEQTLMAAVTAAIEAPGFDINRLGGPLGQTPVIAAVTGTDYDDRVGRSRLRLTSLLLRHGADPDLPERHPMAVDAVIRSAVLNHFECLQEISRFMGPLAFAAALNERPAVNGQTALHDTVHRALTAPDESLQRHLDQLRWVVAHGGRTDIPDFTGVTVADQAGLAVHDAILGRRAPMVLSALDLASRHAAV